MHAKTMGEQKVWKCDMGEAIKTHDIVPSNENDERYG